MDATVSPAAAALALAASLLSLAATAVVLLAVSRSPVLRALPARLQATTAFVDAAWFAATAVAAGGALAGHEPAGGCAGVGFVGAFCALASMAWGAAIFVNLRHMLADPAAALAALPRDEALFHAAIWPAAAVGALLPTLAHAGALRLPGVPVPTFVLGDYGTCGVTAGAPWLRVLVQSGPAAAVLAYMVATTRWALARVAAAYPDDDAAARRVRVRCARYIAAFALAWGAVIAEDAFLAIAGAVGASARLPPAFAAVRATLFYTQGAVNAAIFAANKGSALTDALPPRVAAALRWAACRRRPALPVASASAAMPLGAAPQPSFVAPTHGRAGASGSQRVPPWSPRWNIPWGGGRRQLGAEGERASLLPRGGARYGVEASAAASTTAKVGSGGAAPATPVDVWRRAGGAAGTDRSLLGGGDPVSAGGSSPGSAGTFVAAPVTPMPVTAAAGAQYPPPASMAQTPLRRAPSLTEVMWGAAGGAYGGGVGGGDPWGILASPPPPLRKSAALPQRSVAAGDFDGGGAGAEGESGWDVTTVVVHAGESERTPAAESAVTREAEAEAESAVATPPQRDRRGGVRQQQHAKQSGDGGMRDGQRGRVGGSPAESASAPADTASSSNTRGGGAANSTEGPFEPMIVPAADFGFSHTMSTPAVGRRRRAGPAAGAAGPPRYAVMDDDGDASVAAPGAGGTPFSDAEPPTTGARTTSPQLTHSLLAGVGAASDGDTVVAPTASPPPRRVVDFDGSVSRGPQQFGLFPASGGDDAVGVPSARDAAAHRGLAASSTRADADVGGGDAYRVLDDADADDAQTTRKSSATGSDSENTG